MLNAFRHQRFNTRAIATLNSGDKSCSTPFGIRDSTLGRDREPWYFLIVLNAFRHQRFNTRTSRALVAVFTCAQRLSASEIQHSQTTGTHRRLFSAQRLSASEIQHRDRSPWDLRTNTVLNAFRHQRFNTWNCHNEPLILVCAQRLSASEIQHLDTASW